MDEQRNRFGRCVSQSYLCKGGGAHITGISLSIIGILSLIMAVFVFTIHRNWFCLV